MNAWDIAWYIKPDRLITDIKHATILAPTLEEAKTKWLVTKPECTILDALCRNLTGN